MGVTNWKVQNSTILLKLKFLATKFAFQFLTFEKLQKKYKIDTILTIKLILLFHIQNIIKMQQNSYYSSLFKT
jgi:hypothetical protein